MHHEYKSIQDENSRLEYLLKERKRLSEYKVNILAVKIELED